MADIASTRAASTFPAYVGAGGGTLQAAYGTYTIAANPTAADIWSACKVPANATVIGGWIQAADIDTGTETLDFDVGWLANGDEVADPDGFGNHGVVTGDVSVHLPVAGIFLPFAGVLQTAGPKTFNAETTLDVTFNVAANAGGTGQITMVALYLTP
ncbi:MAG: hypothetical protein OEY97_07785 [Nitrospirota bacterium]|nr:hypothetical protein [Gammaproteobacteria bacterium]MDH5527191.1 hypothetical protein [Nitrospirota bacterium]